MTDTKNELMQQRDCNSSMIFDVNNDIIDVPALYFGNPDTWLQRPSQDFRNDGIYDIRAWLKSQTEEECNNSQDDKRSTDTRTFTRPKKRSGCLNFQSIVDTNLRRSSNVWNQVSPSISATQVLNDNTECTKTEREAKSHVLRSPILGVNSHISTYTAQTFGQGSLEAYFNMPRSREIDSFKNPVEPELNEYLMDISQPSIFYSSVMSINMDDLSQTANHSLTLNQSQISQQSGMEDSQILTESMMQMSMFSDVMNINLNDSFAKNDANITVLENTSYFSPIDTTFLAIPGIKSKETLNNTFNTVTFNRGHIQSMDTTYTPSQFNFTVTKDPHASYIVDRSTCQTNILNNFDATFDKTPRKSLIKSAHEAHLLANELPTMTNESVINETFKVRCREKISTELNKNVELASQTYNIRNFEATFEKTVAPSLTKSSIKLVREAHLPTNYVPATMNECVVNEAFKAHSCDEISAKFDENVDLGSQTHNIRNFDATFEKTVAPSPKKSSIKLVDETHLPASDVQATMNERVINEAFKAHSCHEISAKVDENVDLASQTHNMQKFDATFEKTAAPSPKKSSIKLVREAHLPTNDVQATTNERVINEAFKAHSCDEISVKLDENVDPLSQGGSLDNLETTFCQPAPKILRQLNIPRPVSKLPQTLQKSNPNLGSNTLKTSKNNPKLGIPRSGTSSLSFNKAARPSTARNVESSLSSKLYGFGRMKSGSEPRLGELKNSRELQSIRTGGSTESVVSTQSTHSAPDFDDRLSVRSDGSSASYSMRTMNIKDFQKIVRMRSECSTQESTPKPRRPVLENNWVAASNDLPSPILKNAPDTYGSRDDSPRSTDNTIKTSSPLLSPTGSLQNLTMDVVKSNNDNIKGNKLTIPRTKTAVPNKTSQASGKPQKNSCERKTGLRPPSNWTSVNKPASGIPRLTSRIPAPKFIRSNTKINQGDMKK